MTASGEEQDVDQKEIQSLALNGKLLTFSEFVLTVYRAMDYYNFEKVHRGVIREWTWRPKPKQVTPMDCLKACFLEKDGWRPRRLSPEDVDMVFLARADRDGRVVDRGRISLNNRPYEHDNLIELHKTRVDVRYDPMDPEWVLCFHEGEFICRAVPVEYSSMKDMDLATRKIKEKASRRKAVAQTYRKLTTQVPDFLEYSQVPAEDKAPALLGSAKRKAQIAEAEQCRPRTEEELATDLARIESYHAADRPVFDNIEDRYQWCLMQLVDGKPLIEKDQRFVKETEAGMDSGTKAYWEVFKESIGINGSDLEEAIL